MPYFRIMTGLRGCYSDSSSNYTVYAESAGKLHIAITDEFLCQSGVDDHDDPSADPCTLEQAQAIFALYSGRNAPSLPTCAASWNEGRMGVLVSGDTESDYAEQELQSCEHWTAPESGTVYFLAPAILAHWVEYGPEGVEGYGHGAEQECEAYMRQAATAYNIPKSGVVVTVSTESEWAFESLHAFSMPCGQTYRGSAIVLAYIPSLGA